MTRLPRILAPWPTRFANLLFPPRCALCDCELDAAHDARLCEACRFKLLPACPPRCGRCAMTLRQVPVTPEGCPQCVGERFHFSRAWAIGDYDGALREVVLRMKHANEDPLSAAMGELAFRRLEGELRSWEPDLVAAIPMHWLRRWFRGTTSAAILAEVLAKGLGAGLASPKIVRRRWTRPQSGLSPAERLANVRGAFRLRRRSGFAGKSVLLVDDILTTAATSNEIARLLVKAGAGKVGVVVLARADDR
ncbi:MAG TPA: ComF family protein [Pirellulales bacterium]|nr:ComF family protein [Pirellulales bacterium]